MAILTTGSVILKSLDLSYWLTVLTNVLGKKFSLMNALRRVVIHARDFKSQFKDIVIFLSDSIS